MRRLFICAAFAAMGLVNVNSQNSQETPQFTKYDVSLRMGLSSLPEIVNSSIRSQFGVEEPAWLSIPSRLSPIFGYALAQDYLKLAVFLPLNTGLFIGSEFLKDDWYLSSVSRMSAGHPIYLYQYDIYKTMRTRVTAGGYATDFAPVSLEDALIAPFCFDYLLDPTVSIGLACSIGGALAYNLLSGKAISPPTGTRIAVKGRSYDFALGSALYWSESLYRSYWAGVGEEAFFRGFILPELVEYLGPIAGIALDSLYFIAVHYAPGKDMLTLLLTYAPVSVFFTLMSYGNDYDFRKSSFAHFWYDMALESIYYLTGQSVSPANCGTGEIVRGLGGIPLLSLRLEF